MTKIVVANQKNILNYHEVMDFLNQIRGKIPKNNVIFCPSYPYLLDYVREGYLVGSQDVSETNKVVTGEVSVSMLSSLTVKYALIGHTERRINKNETEKDIVKKIKELIKNDITPLFCIGEMNEEKFEDVIQRLKNTFQNLTLDEIKKIFICYEPMDAIGTNKEIDVQELEDKIKKMKETILKEYHTDTKVLYGGSVDSENVKEILNISVLDGVFLGSASIQSSEFLKIIEVAVTM